MDMNNTTLIVCLAVAYVAFYYYNKFQESEREYIKLHSEHTNALREMQSAQARLHDLQTYKDDVSKTFEILDKELVTINEHIKNKDNSQQPNRVSMLTPEVLGMLFDNMNQEETTVIHEAPGQQQEEIQHETPVVDQQPLNVSCIPTGESYQQYLLHPGDV